MKIDPRKLKYSTFLDRIKFKKLYDYSLITEEWWDENYKNTSTKLPIICSEHGEFYQTFNNHIKKDQGCPICGKLKKVKNSFKKVDQYIEEFNKIHLDKYNYSKVNYINNKHKIEILCPKHGSFWQSPNNHHQGSGCPKCNSSKGEKYIRNYLLENSYTIMEQYSFKDSSIKNLRFDFYIPEYNLCIEYDGIQHFEAIEYFGGEEALASCKEKDSLKDQYCKENNINLLRIPYWEFYNIEILIQEKIEYCYFLKTR